MAYGGSVIHHVFFFFEVLEHAVQVFVADPSALSPEHFAPAEEEERGDGVDAVTADRLRVLGRIDIDLEDIRSSDHLLPETFDHRLHLLAGTAP